MEGFVKKAKVIFDNLLPGMPFWFNDELWLKIRNIPHVDAERACTACRPVEGGWHIETPGCHMHVNAIRLSDGELGAFKNDSIERALVKIIDKDGWK